MYKVVEGMPAHECGKIAIGDKLLEVTTEISSFSSCHVK